MTPIDNSDSSSTKTVKPFSPQWWENKDVTVPWCENFYESLVPPLSEKKEDYDTAGIVLFHKPNGDIIPAGVTEKIGNKFIFQYHPSYLANADVPAIAEAFPKRAERYESEGKLLSFFDNLLAEGWLGMEQAKAIETNPQNVDRDLEPLNDRYERLMMFGRDCPGAVSVTYIKIDPELIQTSHEAMVTGALEAQASISGRHSKLLATMCPNKRCLTPTNTRETSTHIVKLQDHKLTMPIEYEYMAIKATKALLPDDECIDASLTQLRLRNGPPRDVLSIPRFDRTPEGGRIHFEEFNQLLGKQTSERDKGVCTDLAGVVEKRMGHEGVKQLYARLMAQFVLGNSDNHFKNYALFHDEKNDTWKFTPSYDLAPTSLLNRGGLMLELTPQMKRVKNAAGESILVEMGHNAMRGVGDINLKHLITLGEQFGLSLPEIKETMDKIVTGVENAKKVVMSDPSPALDREIHDHGRTYTLRQIFCNEIEAKKHQLFDGKNKYIEGLERKARASQVGGRSTEERTQAVRRG